MIDDILQERGSRYGDFAVNSMVSQSIKFAMRNSPNWPSKLTPDKREALELIALKISRILSGDPDYKDNWIDIVGYTELVIKNLRFEPAHLQSNSVSGTHIHS